MKNFFRKEILEMSGYVPGEQPKERKIVKLNTNENPFPPSPKITKLLLDFDTSLLRLYPDPESCEIRNILAEKFAVSSNEIIIGNGSDDILNIITRCCTDKKMSMAFFEPSYSLYPVLAKMQGAKSVIVPLEKDFSMPKEIPSKALDASLFMITRPNAPTGNSFPKWQIEDICRKSNGIVLIDEAYADFAEDNCVDLLKRFENLIICRTLSKSYSLAGIRLGFAIAPEKIISQMMKVKDSYNVCRLSQEIAKIAILDEGYFQKNITEIKANRNYLSEELKRLGFYVIDSEANFVFVSPPKGGIDAREIYLRLKKQGIFIRYFSAEKTKDFIRITVGRKDEIRKLIRALKGLKNQ